ncbi:hypothetical protein JHK82_050640 [Glycine max]|uniref:Uncharacterized protein n=1 Tax=Glycine max TaxID=3847 RepID=A0A0R0FAV9_SOYBN|nr:hypothetical protein JHK85_051351 [Glycine max]KAG5091862.1 hypothetical protein JHK82_050640 [Glycine max]KAG5094961.1 hypothetical protein JHK84_050549 [Glycine max]
MSPKASGTSLRGGRSTGNGFRLALPKPTIKKSSSTTSWSPNQAGSSTQKPKIEGSSTQIISIKPESSAQESPKPSTSKQTKADYAFPIETLQALQEISITKLPKKTWVDVTSESDEDSEIDLQTMIQKTKNFKTIVNSKGKQTMSQPQTPPPKQTNNKNPFKATTKVSPPEFHFKPTVINKTRTFYEFVLINSNSVSIKYFKDPKDQSLNTHSTIQILKVMQPRHFGPNLNQAKKFSVPFDPIVFWHQNIKFKHSWLIYFKTNTVYNFPNWFLQWWDFFGSIPKIFPEQVQQGYAQFNKLYNFQESQIPADRKYFSSFALSWIFSWQCRYNKTEESKNFLSLQTHAFVKWWTQFDVSKVEPEQVKLWFIAHLEPLKAADPETSSLLNQKSQIATFLASSRSKESLAKNLKEVLQLLQQEEDEGSSSKKEETNSSKEDDPFYQNENDYFGISLNDD